MKKLFWKIFSSFILILITTVLIINIFVFKEFRESYLKQIEADLVNSAYLIVKFLGSTMKQNEIKDIHFDEICKNYGKIRDLRITIININGQVLGDSNKDIKNMDNHIDRPEILSALKGECGKAIRYSATLKTSMMYIAVPCFNKSKSNVIVRTSYPLSLIEKSERNFIFKTMFIGVFVLFVAAGFSYYMAYRISTPLIKIKKWAEDFAGNKNNTPIYVDGPYEVESLARTMNKMMRDINSHIAIISDKERELSTLISSMSEGVIAVDLDKRILFINKMATNMFAVKNFEYKDNHLLEMIRCFDLEQLIIDTIKQQKNMEIEFDVDLQTIKVFKLKSALLKSTDGTVLGVVVVVSDVTRIRRLENIRSDFVANVSHELKTPITSIKGYVETLLEEIHETKNIENFLNIILNQSNRLNSIINDLLMLSNIEQDEKNGSVVFELHSIGEIVNEAISICNLKASNKSIKIILESNNNDDLIINSYLLGQAMINLIDNAIKYSKENSEIRIRIDKINNYLNIHIIDCGIGIAKEHIPRLFERFYRIDKARSRKMGGTGLGLAITKHIVNIHKGNIICTSEQGKGTTFRIQIPLQTNII